MSGHIIKRDINSTAHWVYTVLLDILSRLLTRKKINTSSWWKYTSFGFQATLVWIGVWPGPHPLNKGCPPVLTKMVLLAEQLN